MVAELAGNPHRGQSLIIVIVDMSREASKKAAKELLALCEAEAVKLPTDPVNAMVVAGTLLNATRENGEFQLDKALKEMIAKFGTKEVATKKRKLDDKKDVKKEADDGGDDADQAKPKRKRAPKKAADDNDEDDGEKKAKPRGRPVATCEDNQELADAFAELSGFEFKRGERFKGGTWSKVAKAIRDHDKKISTGKEAQKLKGIGKSAAAKIDEFLETGTLQTLEEYRAGNM